MSKSMFITGNSSGLGLALTELYLQQGYTVYGLSRRACPVQHPANHHIQGDLDRLDSITADLESLLADCTSLDVIYLNAGVLGKLQPVNDLAMEELELEMRINVWSNKIILDWCLARNLSVNTIIAVSSGAAVKGSRGWAGYALSKATLNMLIQLYAHEFPETRLIALAPGLIETAMQEYIGDAAQVSATDFPTVQRLRDARGTAAMQTPAQAAAAIYDLLPRLQEVDSGSFVDIRTFNGGS